MKKEKKVILNDHKWSQTLFYISYKTQHIQQHYIPQNWMDKGGNMSLTFFPQETHDTVCTNLNSTEIFKKENQSCLTWKLIVLKTYIVSLLSFAEALRNRFFSSCIHEKHLKS